MGRKRGRGWIFDLYPSANTIVLWLIEEGGVIFGARWRSSRRRRFAICLRGGFLLSRSR
ncbi:MAG: hypothetical protein V1878_01360 [bacterium]